MIAYLDASVLARAYLDDEDGHEAAAALLEEPDFVAVTGTLTRIEVSGAIVRAGKAGRCDVPKLLRSLDEDLGHEGPVTVLSVPLERIEPTALDLVRAHGIHAMDAWHVAVAEAVLPDLADPGETPTFVTRDKVQAQVAEALGFQVI